MYICILSYFLREESEDDVVLICLCSRPAPQSVGLSPAPTVSVVTQQRVAQLDREDDKKYLDKDFILKITINNES